MDHMARPPDADSTTTIARICGAALGLVEESGRQGLTFRRVAERAELSTGTIRYYFPTMEDLVEAVVEHHHRDQAAWFEARAMDLASSGADARTNLRTATAWVFEHATTNRHLVALRLTQQSDRRMEWQQHALRFASLLSPPGTPEVLARIRMQSVIYIGARLVVSPPEERELLLGLPADTPLAETDALLRDHLVDLAERILFGPPDERPPESPSGRCP
jgi:AcrR family transcriptional regulator